MKLVITIACLIAWSAYGQGWRDTLSMARNAYKQQRYEDALSYYESVQKSAPESVNLSDEMAQSAYKARKFEQAEKIYQQNHKQKKTSKERSESMHNMGNSRMKQKNYKGAIDAYKEALRQNPNDEETRYNLSEAIRQQKEEEKKEQQNQQNNQDNSSQNQNQDQQNNGQNNSQNQDEQNGQDNGQNSNDQNDSNGNSQQGNQGTLQNKTVERLLDQLMKDEAETKRKMAGSERGSGSSKSGKDW